MVINIVMNRDKTCKKTLSLSAVKVVKKVLYVMQYCQKYDDKI